MRPCINTPCGKNDQRQKQKIFDVQKENVASFLEKMKQAGRQHLNEEEARQVISSYGFRIPKSILAASETEVVKAAEEIGYPVVIKISSPDILHKSDFGGVRIGVKKCHRGTNVFLRYNTKGTPSYARRRN